MSQKGGGDGQAAGPPKRRSPLDFLDNRLLTENTNPNCVNIKP
jgi:hypothetical protein